MKTSRLSEIWMKSSIVNSYISSPVQLSKDDSGARSLLTILDIGKDMFDVGQKTSSGRLAQVTLLQHVAH
jgi:hypothetical protein